MKRAIRSPLCAIPLLAGLALAMYGPPPAAAQAAGDAGVTFGRHELPIHDTARMGTHDEMERLLRLEPGHRDARTEHGSTPLHHAALNVDDGPLRALLAAGANPNARDREGRTPLHMAAFATRTGHAKLLLRAGADPLLKTDAGRDVMSMARRVRADELAGEVALWILKGCTPQTSSC